LREPTRQHSQDCKPNVKTSLGKVNSGVKRF
jgi:hypothetical protein